MNARGKLVLGDCLDVLPTLVRTAADRFDLVYADPPFNAGGKRGARAGTGERARGTTAYTDEWGGLDAFLAMLEPRLQAVRDVMGPRSSLWIHLDHRTVHDVKVILDRLFGRDHFAGEVIWVPGNGARKKKGPSVTHQTILIYAKGKQMIWNTDDPALREPFADTSLRMHFKNTDSEGRKFRDRKIGGKVYRYYADVGRKLGSVWSDCPAMNANTPLTKEATGYPTQKPEALLERILLAASNESSRVLDPMCGSGTTPAVAKRLGRFFVGIDRSTAAMCIAEKRLAAVR